MRTKVSQVERERRIAERESGTTTRGERGTKISKLEVEWRTGAKGFTEREEKRFCDEGLEESERERIKGESERERGDLGGF